MFFWEGKINFGKCKSGKGKLKVQENDLNFKLLNEKNGPGDYKTLTLTVGSCSLNCDVIGKTSDKARLQFPRFTNTFFFPVPVKLNTEGYTVGEGSTAIQLTCTSVYNPSQTGMVVEFNFSATEKIPGLRITFENAHVFNVTDTQSKWGIKSWRLWAVIGSGIASVMILAICAGLGIWWCCSKKNKKEESPGNMKAMKTKVSKKGLNGAAIDASTTTSQAGNKNGPKEPKSLMVKTAKPLIGNFKTKEAEEKFLNDLREELIQLEKEPLSDVQDAAIAKKVAVPPVAQLQGNAPTNPKSNSPKVRKAAST
ncbi:hypothetical protein M3Y98_01186300 [Aphelenchoides besseyi]|nr:hypothetical protein M3Y98_01186300 [Aphelenchoides besseyi]